MQLDWAESRGWSGVGRGKLQSKGFRVTLNMIGRATDNTELCKYGHSSKQLVSVRGCGNCWLHISKWPVSMQVQSDLRRQTYFRVPLGIQVFRNPPKLALGWLEAQSWCQIFTPLWIPLNFICISVIALCSALLCSGLERSNVLTDFVSLRQDQGLPPLGGSLAEGQQQTRGSEKPGVNLGSPVTDKINDFWASSGTQRDC